jgi:hypothetical protein
MICGEATAKGKSPLNAHVELTTRSLQNTVTPHSHALNSAAPRILNKQENDIQRASVFEVENCAIKTLT